MEESIERASTPADWCRPMLTREAWTRLSRSTAASIASMAGKASSSFTKESKGHMTNDEQFYQRVGRVAVLALAGWSLRDRCVLAIDRKEAWFQPS